MFESALSESEDESPQPESSKVDRLKQLRHRDAVRDYQYAQGDYLGTRKRNAEETLSDGEEETAVPIKKSAAERMMEKMGFREGEGLGKNRQGISKPIELSTQRGRTGIGHEGAKALQHDVTVAWDDSEEKKTVEETPYWIPEFPDEEDNADQETYFERQEEVNRVLKTNKAYLVTTKKMTIDDEHDVVQKEILANLLKAKTVFDHLNDRDLREARARANPYETIASGIFQNRAAMKAANMDGVFDFIFSQEDMNHLEDKCPLDINKTGTNLHHRDDELFYFADVCAGPGGFSEYALWRKGFYNAKGFGFTLKGKDDFKLTKFMASSPMFFEPFYGFHDDGDVTKPKNIDSFEEMVKLGTDGKGVHLMMADGGFSVEGQENIQEILSKRIYLCQLLVSLCVVREGGNFYCKLFDLFTRFSYELVFLMRLCYREVCIHKPHTSRPANSERYIVCKGLMRKFSEPVKEFLKDVNRTMEKLTREQSDDDIQQILPDHFGNELTQFEVRFLAYITSSNNSIASRQIHYLEKYRAFATNPGLIDKDQADLREKCMQYWRVPYDMQPNRDRRRMGANRQRENFSPETLLSKYSPKMFGSDDFFVKPLDFEKEWKTFFYANAHQNQLVHEEYRCVWATEDRPGQSKPKMPSILVSTPDSVYVFKNNWDQMDQFKFRVPGHSILLVELTTEMTKDRNSDKLSYPRSSEPSIIRILDAAVLAGDNISLLKYERRMECVKKFCKAINLVENCVHVAMPVMQQNNRGDRRGFDNRPRFERRMFIPLKLIAAEVFTLDRLSENLPRGLNFQNEFIVLVEEETRTFKASGVHVFKYIADGWSMYFSKSANRSYAFMPKQPSVFSDQFEPKGIVTSFWDTAILSKKRHYRMFWNWRNTYNESMYGPRAILEQESNAGGPTVREVERRVEQMRAGQP